MSDLLQAQLRRESRWRILRTLEAGRPMKLRESILLSVLGDTQMIMTITELRRDLDYLEQHGLVDIERAKDGWLAELSAKGIDIVEYAKDVEVPPGVARPLCF